jgi:predicted choloylglycine hydrolase
MSKEIILKQDIIISLLIIILGFLSNYAVLSLNDGRMPVQTKYYLDDSTHFSFQDQDEIKLYYLADIFPIKTKNYTLTISVGDMLLGLGYLMLLMNLIRLIIYKHKNKGNK